MKKFFSIGLAFLLILSVSASVFAGDFKVNGVYTAWGLSQNKFFMGKNDGNDNYFVQMLRFNVQAVANDNLKAVTRFDIAQGWWGVDNEQRTFNGASGLFDNKDTNFLVHIDQAYVDFNCPNIPVNFKVGRMWYGVGNKLILDNNLDGIQATVNLKKANLMLGWSKMSEGVDGLSDNETVAPDPLGNTDARDADLLLGNLKTKTDSREINIFGLYYNDQSTKDNTAYLLDGLDYFRPRFAPHVTQLMVFGVSGIVKFGKFSVTGEFDYLTGKDDISNTNYDAKQRYDINNGDLSGYNLYLKPVFQVVPKKFSLGGVIGIGSGDEDKTGGAGNINKLRTSGFFYVTEIWEDSIMPDEEGITPQGLGAPNTRGYREFENSTLFQLNGTYNVKPNLSTFVSFTLIKATQPIYEWTTGADENGSFWTIGSANSKDIGKEIDFKVDYKIYSNLIFTVRGGIFMPGDAAGYLINGTNEYNDNVKELKSTLTYKF